MRATGPGSRACLANFERALPASIRATRCRLVCCPMAHDRERQRGSRTTVHVHHHTSVAPSRSESRSGHRRPQQNAGTAQPQRSRWPPPRCPRVDRCLGRHHAAPPRALAAAPPQAAAAASPSTPPQGAHRSDPGPHGSHTDPGAEAQDSAYKTISWQTISSTGLIDSEAYKTRLDYYLYAPNDMCSNRSKSDSDIQGDGSITKLLPEG